jgi:hypothetical protein
MDKPCVFGHRRRCTGHSAYDEILGREVREVLVEMHHSESHQKLASYSLIGSIDLSIGTFQLL